MVVAVGVIVAAVAVALVATVRPGAAARREAVPADSYIGAKLVGYNERVRYFPRDAVHVEEFKQDYLASLERERVLLRAQGWTGDQLPPAALLVISGGGDGGAFGAGVLNGWTRTGKRPRQTVVTCGPDVQGMCPCPREAP